VGAVGNVDLQATVDPDLEAMTARVVIDFDLDRTDAPQGEAAAAQGGGLAVFDARQGDRGPKVRCGRADAVPVVGVATADPDIAAVAPVGIDVHLNHVEIVGEVFDDRLAAAFERPTQAALHLQLAGGKGGLGEPGGARGQGVAGVPQVDIATVVSHRPDVQDRDAGLGRPEPGVPGWGPFIMEYRTPGSTLMYCRQDSIRNSYSAVNHLLPGVCGLAKRNER